MRYMVVEHFNEGAVPAIYRRFAEKGRMLPEGLRFVDSWIAADLRICYQLMETDDPALFEIWTRNWADLAEFDIVPVIPSDEARRKALQ